MLEFNEQILGQLFGYLVKAITNYSALDKRRLEISIVVDYKTNTNKLKKILLDIAKDKRILKDPAPYYIRQNPKFKELFLEK